MEICEASEGDIPEIVALLKVSLGESLMPKSERYWRWKHLENPFGPSPVLLCREGNLLIGVRAFMRWEWIYQGEVYRAIRAVDTATHPDHQGKGIFKKLTLSLVDYCMKRGDHFVFNTPNQRSKPGYLKMGWEQAGKVPLHISIRRPFSMLKNIILNAGTLENETENNSIKYYLNHAKLEGLMKHYHSQSRQIITNISLPYLTWRYFDVPVAHYLAIGDEQGGELNGLVVARIKNTRIGRELRITDCFLKETSDGKALIKKIRETKEEWHIDYTTLSGNASTYAKKIFKGFKAPVGPMVTIRSLCMTDLHTLKHFEKWSPTVGDLELF